MPKVPMFKNKTRYSIAIHLAVGGHTLADTARSAGVSSAAIYQADKKGRYSPRVAKAVADLSGKELSDLFDMIQD